MLKSTVARFAACVIFYSLFAAPGRAAELILTRRSRIATLDEITGGVPTDSVIHDFFITSAADLLSLSGIELHVPLYQHEIGSDFAAPAPGLLDLYPALAADSYFTLPGSSVTLGGGFSGGQGSLWGDFTEDAQLADFRFGRLTSHQAGSFRGQFALRGDLGPVYVPFEFLLPDANAGPDLLSAGTTLSLTYSPMPALPPVVPPTLPVIPPVLPPAPAPTPGPVTPPWAPPVATPTPPPAGSNWGSVTLTRTARVTSEAEVLSGAPLGGLVHEFFASTSSDILSIGNVAVTAPLYHHDLGANHGAATASLSEVFPALGVDSFLDTPGDTVILGDGFSSPGVAAWADLSNDGAQANFRFAQLTTTDAGEFSGTLTVRGGDGPVNVPFTFPLQASAVGLPLPEVDSAFTVFYSLDPTPPAQPPVIDPAPPLPPAEPIDVVGPLPPPIQDPLPPVVVDASPAPADLAPPLLPEPPTQPWEQPIENPEIIGMPHVIYLAPHWIDGELVALRRDAEAGWMLLHETESFELFNGSEELVATRLLHFAAFDGALTIDATVSTAATDFIAFARTLAAAADAEMAVPEPSAGALVLAGAALAVRRRQPRPAR